MSCSAHLRGCSGETALELYVPSSSQPGIHCHLSHVVVQREDNECCRAHNLRLEPAVSLTELLPLIRAAPTAWVGAAGGSPLREQSHSQSAGAANDRSLACHLHMSFASVSCFCHLHLSSASVSSICQFASVICICCTPDDNARTQSEQLLVAQC